MLNDDMNRSDLIRRMLLRAIADDYENVDQVIYRQCVEAGAVIETDFKTYFYIMKKGIDLLSQDTWWPFNGEGQPR
jgi:hypothetical protein